MKKQLKEEVMDNDFDWDATGTDLQAGSPTTVRLTNNQKSVLVAALSAPTEKLAAIEISSDDQLVAARDTLVQLGYLQYTSTAATVTDNGLAAMRSEDLIDTDNELTDTGREFLGVENGDEAPNSAEPEGSDAFNPGFVGGLGDNAPFEGISLIRDINNKLNESRVITSPPGFFQAHQEELNFFAGNPAALGEDPLMVQYLTDYYWNDIPEPIRRGNEGNIIDWLSYNLEHDRDEVAGVFAPTCT